MGGRFPVPEAAMTKKRSKNSLHYATKRFDAGTAPQKPNDVVTVTLKDRSVS